MGSKQNGKKLNKSIDNPGPGAYQPDDTKTRRKGPKFGFGTEGKLKNRGQNSYPDPASYDIKDNIMRKTAASVGMGFGDKIDLSKSITETPGPGAYDFRSTVTDGKKIGMGIKTDTGKGRMNNKSPGPGAYSISHKTAEKSGPKFGFGTSSRLQNAGKQQVPDPATYDVNDSLMKKASSSVGMGYGQKHDFVKNLDNTPGPGTYEAKSTITEGKKFGIGLKTELMKPQRENGPGPGAYKSEIVNLNKQHKSYKIGKGVRFDK